MSGDDTDMDEILDDIRTLRGGEAPLPRNEPKTPRVGYLKGSLLVLPAALVAIPLLAELTRMLSLPFDGYSYIAPIISLLMMKSETDGSRPADRRHWAILVAVAMACGAAIALTAVGVIWLFTPFTQGSLRDLMLPIVAILGCGSAVFLVLWIADRLTRADNLIFPRDAEEIERGAG